MTTAKKLKKIRLRLCLSKSEFARLIPINRSSITLYENGDRNPSFSTLRKIVAAVNKEGLEIKFEDILDE